MANSLSVDVLSPMLAADGPTAVDVRDGSAVRRVPLEASRLVVGRAPDAEIHVDNVSVSRRHAELYRDPFGRWWVRDLGSRNGTLVNGQRVSEQLLCPADVVQVGGCSLSLAGAAHTTCGVGTGTRPNVQLSTESDGGRISTLKEVEPPRLAATHLTTLNTYSQQLLTCAAPGDRLSALCQLMAGPEFHARSAVVLRVANDEGGDESPEVLCSSVPCGDGASRTGVAPPPPYVSRSLLRAVRETGEPVLATNSFGPAGAGGGGNGSSRAAIEVSIAPSVMDVSALACPIRQDGRYTDVFYATLPPEYCTGEWLALAALAAKQYQQAEQVWQARAMAETHAVVERELERARQIQMRLVPREPSVAGLDLSVGFVPCRWVGGDYVDVVPMADGRTLLTVADVCGKGLAAALVSASLHTMVHGSLAAGLDLTGLMRNLNRYLCGTLPSEAFVTMVAVAVDPATGRLECINAGHPPPLLASPDGGAVEQMECGLNLPLGCDDGELEGQTAELPPGTLVALYTDGLTETADEDGAMLGISGLSEYLHDACAVPASTAASTADALADRLDRLRGRRPPDDDHTFLLARRV